MSSSRPLAIRVEGISKRYHLGGRVPYRRLSETLSSLVRRPGPRRHTGTIWALRDVSFELEEGEILGIVGRNGAGKTTLLRVLSKITLPTRGRAEIYGRVGSLLEVGTGFHPELTGRENVFLNGAILGMTRREIARKYDDIVAFAQIEPFMDTPVKHYSSGQRVRLAFSVAAYLEPEILFIDEVLAVGDAAFQQKCLGRMEEVSRSGRTVLFVSHNMGAVISLCTRALWLEDGRIKMDGDPAEVVEAYLSEGQVADGRWVHPGGVACGSRVRLASVEVLDDDGHPQPIQTDDRPIRIRIEHEVLEPTMSLALQMRVTDAAGNDLFTTSNLDDASAPHSWEPGRYAHVVTIPPNLLRAGRYWLTVSARRFRERLDVHDHVLSFEVAPTRGRRARRGLIAPILPWSLEARGVRA